MYNIHIKVDFKLLKDNRIRIIYYRIITYLYYLEMYEVTGSGSTKLSD